MKRKVEVWIVLLIIWAGIVFTELFSWASLSHIIGSQRAGVFGKIAYNISMFPATAASVIEHLSSDFKNPLLIKNRWPSMDKFSVAGKRLQGALKDGGYLLLSTYDYKNDQPIVKLIRIRDQNVLHTWTIKGSVLNDLYFEELDDDPRNFDELSKQKIFHQLLHPLLLNDGSIIVNLDHTRLLKLNFDSELVWACKSYSHHSIELGPNGKIWIPSRIIPSEYDELLSNKQRKQMSGYLDHAITAVSQSGEVIFKKSIAQILIDNGYESLLFGTGTIENNAIHLNDIQPALYSTDYWNIGDLLISMRNKSTVFLYRPSTKKIIWLKTGPWLHQHDVDFVGDSKLSIFSNNTILNPDHTLLKPNDVYLYDFSEDSVTNPYNEIMSREGVRTLSAGQQKVLNNGDLFVEETNYGRLLRLSQDDIIWEYTETVDSNTVAMVAWSRYLSSNQIQDNIILKSE